MKTRLVVTVLLLGMIGAGQPLFACGEKFRVGIRGTRFQRPPVARTAASILIYANPALNLSRALASVAVDDTLRKAGYRPTTVRSPKEFQTALDRGLDGAHFLSYTLQHYYAHGETHAHGESTPS